MRLLVFLGLLALASPSRAGAGAEPFEFLFLDAQARPVAMGGAYTALARDAQALRYNPAGLAKVSRHEAAFAHNAYLQGTHQESAAYASPRGWGVSLDFFEFGGVQRTSLSNPGGTGLGEAGMNDLALGAGYGAMIAPGLSLGLGFKFLREVLDDFALTGYGVDLGAHYYAPWVEGLSLGAVVQNAGPPARSGGSRENLPLNLRFSGAYEFQAAGRAHALVLDVTKERSQGALVAAGGETRMLEPLALRLGYGTRGDAGIGIAAGFGYLFKSGSVDYAFVPMGELGDAHRVSVTLKWGGGRPR
jgi:hypothetical protein